MCVFSYRTIRIYLNNYCSCSSVLDACELATIGGGCPDILKCKETCLPCFQGVGEVSFYCRPANAAIPYDECVCSMSKGAPCNVPGCPKPWNPPSPSSEGNVNGTVLL